MLIVLLHNDGSGTNDAANYDAEVRVTPTSKTMQTIWQGRVEGHNRLDGWPTLLRQLADAAEQAAEGSA